MDWYVGVLYNKVVSLQASAAGLKRGTYDPAETVPTAPRLGHRQGKRGTRSEDTC